MLAYVIEKKESIITALFVLFISWSMASTTNSLIIAAIGSGSGTVKKASSSNIALNRFRRRRKRPEDYAIIIERNIFDSKNRQPEDKNTTASQPEEEPRFHGGPAVKSSLPVKLLGTMVFSNPKYSFATIKENSSGDTKNVYIGDKILGKARVTEILRNRIYVIHNNRKEYLDVEGNENLTGPPALPHRTASRNPVSGIGSTIRRRGNTIIIDERDVAAALENMGVIATQARVVPNFVNGKVNGFKIFAIKQGSIYQKLGVRNGDIIQKINDFEINSPEKALQVYTQLRNEKNINIDLIRRGKKQTLHIEIR